jgi:hypothetical protein
MTEGLAGGEPGCSPEERSRLRETVRRMEIDIVLRRWFLEGLAGLLVEAVGGCSLGCVG